MRRRSFPFFSDHFPRDCTRHTKAEKSDLVASDAALRDAFDNCAYMNAISLVDEARRRRRRRRRSTSVDDDRRVVQDRGSIGGTDIPIASY